MHAPARMVRDNQVGELLRPLGHQRLAQAIVFGNILSIWRTRIVAGEIMLERRRVELELARRGLQRMGLRILRKRCESADVVFPILGGRSSVVTLLAELLPADELLASGMLKALANPFLLGLAPGVFLVKAHALGDFAHHLVVAQRFAARLDASRLDHHDVRIAIRGVDTDVALLELGVDRQQDVSVYAVVFEPGMLNEHELDIG